MVETQAVETMRTAARPVRVFQTLCNSTRIADGMWEANATAMTMRRPVKGSPGHVHRMWHEILDNGSLVVKYDLFDETSRTVLQMIGSVDSYSPLSDLRISWPTKRLGLVSGARYDAFVGALVNAADVISAGSHSEQLTYTANGSLPAGLVLGPDGYVRGTLTSAPSSSPKTIRVSVHEVSSGTVLDASDLTTVLPPAWTTPAFLGTVVAGVPMDPIELAVQAPPSGLKANLSIVYTTLPEGSISLAGAANRHISGTPSGIRTHDITVRAFYPDSYMGESTRTFKIACVKA